MYLIASRCLLPRRPGQMEGTNSFLDTVGRIRKKKKYIYIYIISLSLSLSIYIYISYHIISYLPEKQGTILKQASCLAKTKTKNKKHIMNSFPRASPNHHTLKPQSNVTNHLHFRDSKECQFHSRVKSLLGQEESGRIEASGKERRMEDT